MAKIKLKNRLPGPMQLARNGEHGRAWYDRAKASVESYASARGHDPDRVADILAITSPRVHVKRNIGITRMYMAQQPLKGVMRGIKAALIHYEETGEIRGPKTGAFARAIKGDSSAVVIDVWMIRAFGGDASKGINLGTYRSYANRVRSIAGRLGWSNAHTQAAIWTGVRAAYGFHGASDLDMETAA